MKYIVKLEERPTTFTMELEANSMREAAQQAHRLNPKLDPKFVSGGEEAASLTGVCDCCGIVLFEEDGQGTSCNRCEEERKRESRRQLQRYHMNRGQCAYCGFAANPDTLRCPHCHEKRQ